ncbi:hypothetical protein [Desulfonatronospira sp.]|uniref:hypothetical protein n=1 Tax=Desulfonatronospira sp. TaxID=1962951 RepID=UPI0025BB69A0|nr:hypothetical protein [Desulfonatronospira sp.]
MDIQGFSVGGGLTALKNSLQMHGLGQELIQKTFNENNAAANAQGVTQSAPQAEGQAQTANAEGVGGILNKIV